MDKRPLVKYFDMQWRGGRGEPYNKNTCERLSDFNCQLRPTEWLLTQWSHLRENVLSLLNVQLC